MKWTHYLTVEGVTIERGVRNVLINLLPDLEYINKRVRPALARLCGLNCGVGTVLYKGVFYGNTRNITIGSNSVISRGVFLDSYGKIAIGSNVVVAFQVTFITSTHELGTQDQRMGELFGSPIVVGDDVWIAPRAIIGPGTDIGAGSTISAGSALMHSVPANSLVAGVPGKVMTRLENGIGATEAVEPTAASSSCPTALETGETSANHLTESIAESAGEARAEDSVYAPERDDAGTSGNALLSRAEFFAELEAMLEMERGSIKGTESLGELRNWDSLAALAFIAMADMKLQEVASPQSLAACRTVSDLADLFPSKIGTNSIRLTQPIAESVSETGTEVPAHAPERSDAGTSGNALMTIAEFLAELEAMLEMERGSIKGTESLGELRNWDSMAALAFIAMADMKLQKVASPASLATCRTVSDLANLFPGRIA